MKIERIELRHIKLQLVHPFETTFGRFSDRHLVILKVFSDVGICFSEAPSLVGPFYSYETTETSLHIIKDFIAPSLLRHEINTIEELHQRLEFIRGHNIAKSSIDTAFYHLMSIKEDKSLSQYLGGSGTHVDVGNSIGIQSDLDTLLERVSWSLENKYRRIKIKVKPGWDLEPIKAIRDHFGDIPLMIDANSAYSLEDIDLFRQLDEYSLLMIEQPLGYDDIYDHSVLQAKIQTPICLDESIHSLVDAKLAVGIGACRVINIKLSRVGGLYPAIQIHDFCKREGIPVWSGGMVESGIGKADSTALSTLPNFVFPADISPGERWFTEDIVSSPLKLVDGRIKVPSSVGIGTGIKENYLDQVSVSPPIVIS